MLKRLLVAVPLAVISAAWFWYLILPWPVLLRVRDPDSTALMRQRAADARAAGDEFEVEREWVPLDEISPRLRRAVVIAEDGRFPEHDGIDWLALREEFRYAGDDDFSWFDPADLRALAGSFNYYRNNRDKVRGRSTITQQLAKNLYFSTDRSPLRKIEEMVVARRFERFLSKDRILEVYLNSVEWGPGVFGAEAAAQHYFDRSAANLSADQSASLAATLPHPLTSNPKLRPARMRWRKNMILARMGGSGPAATVPLAPPGEEPVSAEPDDTMPAPIGVPAAPDAGGDSGVSGDSAAVAPPDAGSNPVSAPPPAVPADTLPLQRPPGTH